jgi:hypothetical protein
MEERERDENTIAGILIGRSQSLLKMEREHGARKTRELTVASPLKCCGNPVTEGHLVTCENYPMEAS